MFECLRGYIVQRIDETIVVTTNQNGEPIGFQWRNRGFLVNAKPVRWFARREWWIEAARVQRGIGAGVLEVEMWRLTAACTEAADAIIAQYEIIHSALDGSWRLSRIYS